MEKISVRMAEVDDYRAIVDYFVKADRDYLKGMGVDPSKLPAAEQWLESLITNHQKDSREKTIYYVIWMYEGIPIGHSNINKIIYGKEAYMHLHMWKPEKRHQGIGLELMKLSIPFYFRQFQLKHLLCEPYALNPAPNKTLPKLGFKFIREYETIPGIISFRQPVNRWELDFETYKALFNTTL